MKWRIATFRGKHASKFTLFSVFCATDFNLCFSRAVLWLFRLAPPPSTLQSTFRRMLSETSWWPPPPSPVISDTKKRSNAVIADISRQINLRLQEEKALSLSLGFGSDTVVLNGIKATGNPLSHLSEREVDSNKTALLKSVFVKRVSSGLHSTDRVGKSLHAKREEIF